MSEREVIFRTALVSRILVLVLQYISNKLIPDHEADAFLYPKQPESTVSDKLVTHFLGGFSRWDAQHFLHIARYGYTYEHTLAFFPLFPIIVRLLTGILSHLTSSLNEDSLCLLVSIIFNNFCFILSALTVYDLSYQVSGKNLAYKASILFCYNPASVFFSAPYTESLFSFLTFKSMLNSILLYKKYSYQNLQIRDVLKIIPVALSCLTRSNGVLNLGFFIYMMICVFLETVKLKRQKLEKVSCAIKFSVIAFLASIFCVIPFILFEAYSYFMFCRSFETHLPNIVLNHPDIQSFVLPGEFAKHNQSWCYNTVPLSYSYIQSHYWKVGFMQYYQWKQIPNFLLATPIIYIILRGSHNFFRRFPKNIPSLFNFHYLKKRNSKSKSDQVLVVFVIHATVLTIFCIFNIHIQVTTRMLCSASPVIFWFASDYVTDISPNLFQKLKRFSSLSELIIIGYFLSYFVVGTLMFSNFLPWT